MAMLKLLTDRLVGAIASKVSDVVRRELANAGAGPALRSITEAVAVAFSDHDDVVQLLRKSVARHDDELGLADPIVAALQEHIEYLNRQRPPVDEGGGGRASWVFGPKEVADVRKLERLCIGYRELRKKR